MQLRLRDPIERVPGVGPARARALRASGLDTVEDLLRYLPARYEDRSHKVRIAELRAGQPACVEGWVHRCQRVRGSRRRARVEAQLEDDSGCLDLVWFNQPYVAERLRRGARLVLYGSPVAYRGRLQVVNPVYAVLPADGAPEAGEVAHGPAPHGQPLHVGRPVPVYRRIGSLGPGTLRRLVHEALHRVEEFDDGLEPFLLGELPSLEQALRAVHEPISAEQLDRLQAGDTPVHQRLALAEFVEFQAALQMYRRRVQQESGMAHPIRNASLQAVTGALPFDLTGGQRRCLAQIVADLRRDRPMHRLLHGDVGAGKTAVAGCAMLVTALAGAQAVLLAPTEVLARQHRRTVQRWAAPLGLQAHLLTGSLPAAQRRRLLAGLGSGEVRLVVGTHALLQPAVRFAKLGLVVVDEQHRFGVAQRALLRAKGKDACPDLLVTSATPIPRSLALTLYGDLAVTALREMPPGRVPVDTRVCPARQWGRLLQEIRETVARRQQVFVVAPRIGASGRDGGRGVETLYRELCQAVTQARVVSLHGELEPAQRVQALESFERGDAAVMVATTMVEVGVDVPAATLMVIDHAERFGLAQLHQLRGRVGRGAEPGRCRLVAHEPLSEVAQRRLRALADTHDGFRLAEQDLRLRGPGELLGARQTGSFGLRTADPFAHSQWMLQAREIAGRILSAGGEQARAYRQSLRARWGRRIQLARAG